MQIIPREIDTPNKFEVDCWTIKTIKAVDERIAPIKLINLLDFMDSALRKLT